MNKIAGYNISLHLTIICRVFLNINTISCILLPKLNQFQNVHLSKMMTYNKCAVLKYFYVIITILEISHELNFQILLNNEQGCRAHNATILND